MSMTAAVEAFVTDVVGSLPGCSLGAGEILAGPDRPADARPGGVVSVNGRCRFIRATDEWIAVQLARPEDLDAVPAIVESEPGLDVEPWDALHDRAEWSSAAELVDRCRMFGVPAAIVGETMGSGRPPIVAYETDVGPGRHARGVIADLAALWAGPLCARLLGEVLGLEVVDVESIHRPDPVRTRDDRLSRLLHTGRGLRTFDHREIDDDGWLDLLGDATIVVTSGRDRSLDSLGLDPRRWTRRGVTWVHVSGYGLDGDLADVTAFGDDAAAAGGVVDWIDGRPGFVLDAVADPLAGLAGAAAALQGMDGPTRYLDVSMAATAAAVAGG